MRVIAGVHRGRRLVAPTGRMLRPTSDRVKEALFSILGSRINGARVLDLYAGTGAIGIEAMSRGAVHVTFVEADPAARQILHENLGRCRGAYDWQVCPSRVEDFLLHGPSWKGPYDIMFADPPYMMTLDVVPLLHSLSLHGMTPHAVAVIEHGRKAALPPAVGTLLFHRRYEYGDTCLSLFHQEPEDPPAS